MKTFIKAALTHPRIIKLLKKFHKLLRMSDYHIKPFIDLDIREHLRTSRDNIVCYNNINIKTCSSLQKFCGFSSGFAAGYWVWNTVLQHPQIVTTFGTEHYSSNIWEHKNAGPFYKRIWNNGELINYMRSPKCGFYQNLASYDTKCGDYIKLLASKFDNALLGKRPKEFIHNRRMWQESFNEAIEFMSYLGKIKVKNSVCAIGHIHTFTLLSSMQLSKSYLENNNIKFFNLLRHPFSRFKSWCGFKVNKEAFTQSDSNMVKRWEDFCVSNELDTNNVMDFYMFCGIDYLKTYCTEMSIDTHHIYSERLQKDPQYFSCFIQYISNGKIIPNKEYIDFAFSENNLNFGRFSSTKESAKQPLEEFYHSLPSWVKAEIRQRMTDEHRSICIRHGYDISFVYK